nr:hypothetical protein [Bacteroidota bacterium]
MKTKIVILLLLISKTILAQQGISNNWIMGYQAIFGNGHSALNFYNGNVQVSKDSLPMDFRHTHANISDSAGNLLFYTNGYYIADATNDTMDNGSGINPGAYANFVPDGFLIPQAALIIPKPNSNSIYYLFHNTADAYPIIPNNSTSYKFYVSTIDMSLNGGLGSVISKNQVLINDSMNVGKISACKHGNGRDWWIVIHRVNSNKFIKFLVTPYSLDGPYFQNIGSYRMDDAGQAKFSPDGTRYAYFHYRSNSDLDVFDFDRCTGTLSNWRNDTLPFEFGNVGCAFSSNSQMLYVGNILNIYQYNLSNNNLLATRNIVAEWDSFKYNGVFATLLCLPELAPDGKIYLTTGNSSAVMHTINNPDVYGMGCNVAQHSLQLPSVYFNTLPNHPNYFLGPALGNPCNNLGLLNPSKGGAKKIRCFNNPTHDKFTLWFPVDKDVGGLEIYDVNGECIRREYVAQWSQYKVVDISMFSGGVYFCKMVWPSGEGSVKVVRLE